MMKKFLLSTVFGLLLTGGANAASCTNGATTLAGVLAEINNCIFTGAGITAVQLNGVMTDMANLGVITVGEVLGTVPGPLTIQPNVVTNAKLAQAPAETLKGNPTNGTANETDVVIGGLTDIATPSSTLDPLLIQNHSTGTLQKTTAQELFNSVIPGVSPQGRLTLLSGDPVLISTVSASSTVYYTPYQGQVEPLWNGGGWIPTNCPEVSNILANSSTGNAGPAAAVASSLYDLFLWNNNGTCTLSRSPAWTNSTTRSVSLLQQNGFLTNNSAIANGPGLNAGLYVGTIATDGSGGTVTFNQGGAASGGTAAFVGLWNEFNRRQLFTAVTDNGTTYTYTSGTIRAARGSTANRVTFVSGLAEDAVETSYNAAMATVAVTSANQTVGVGLDSTTAFGLNTLTCFTSSNNNLICSATLVTSFAPQIGQHFIQALEVGDVSNANVFNRFSNNQLQMQFLY